MFIQPSKSFSHAKGKKSATIVAKLTKSEKKRFDERRTNFNPKKKGEDSPSIPKCYECNQLGHLRVDYPSFKKRMEKFDTNSNNQLLLIFLFLPI